jgi:hypothetical protein
MKERFSAALGATVVLVAVLACKGKTEDVGPASSAATTATATETATATASSDTAAASASGATKPSASASAKPKSTCHGLMIGKRCAKECVKDDDCSDPKERCAPFSGADDDGQDVQGAVVCQYDKDNEPRAAKPTVGVPAPKGGDCAAGWAPSVSEANKCDKECKTDAECGPGNKCKAVGPQGSGKQCQKG